jgi:hypothetical protein
MKARFPGSFTTFKKGEKVWLKAKNLKLLHLSKKIAPEDCTKRAGPFKISEVITPVTYQLHLPTSWHIHNVFHSSLLTPFKETDAHRPSYPTPIPDIINGEEEFKIEGILKHKIKSRKTHFLIRWKNCPTTEDSWEPEQNVTHTQDAVREYWARIEQHNRRRKQRETDQKESPPSRPDKAPSQNRIYFTYIQQLNRKQPEF